MINAFYSGLSGMTSYQSKLDITANNLANVNTPGFKQQGAQFLDLDYSAIYKKQENNQEVSVGNGVRLGSTSSVLDQGNIENTDRTLDVAIEGEGYFKVEDSNSNQYYTRSGNFQMKKDSDGFYLATANGYYVLDSNSQKIQISQTSGNIVFTANNSNSRGASTTEGDTTQYIDIGVYTFNNPYALIRDGASMLKQSDSSGEAGLLTGAKVKQGALEGSNVDMAQEMTNLMLAQRGFSFSSKVLQTADEIENIANNLRT